MIAKFIGQDGSLGFRTGRKYIINIERDNNNNWIWVKELLSISKYEYFKKELGYSFK